VDIHKVDFDIFEASTPVGTIKMTNIIAKIPGAQPDTIILGGHYDTKRMKLRFVGANDGASSPRTGLPRTASMGAATLSRRSPESR
jgi:hypothetical protein